MNIVTGIVIAIVVLYLIFKILFAIIEGLANFLGEVTDGFKKTVFYLFGKKFLKRKVNIPNGLLPDSKPLPVQDTQYLYLKNYHPTSAHIPHREVILFKSDIERLTDPHTEATKLFYIDDLSEILVPSVSKCYEQFFDILYQDPHYLAPKPKMPKTFFHLPIGRNGKFDAIDFHLEDQGGHSYSAF
ncbi:MAG: hypothetical protein GY850_05955 [bacterium]|nr:hypothetical protein [bacterium]